MAACRNGSAKDVRSKAASRGVRTARHFTARRNADLVRDLADMKALMKDRSAEIVDARARRAIRRAKRRAAAGLRSGHIPGAHNLALCQADQQGRNAQVRRPRSSGCSRRPGSISSKPVVTSCGSGITASVLALALAVIGHRRTSVYDGSWSEWGADKTLPIETS